MTRPAVTALVCTRERPELLPRCLRALAADLRAGDELLVIESGTPHAASVLDSLGVTGRVLRSEQPQKSHKLNLGVREATSELLVLTDDDVEVPVGWTDGLAAPLVADAEMGVTFGPVRGLSGTGETHHLPPGPAPVETWAYAHGAAMGLRRAAVVDAGGFDERLGPGAAAHGEEHDLLLRIWERGWRAAIADAPVVAHMDWRSSDADRANRLVYERGAGAVVGAALRRRPSRWWKYAVLRARFELAVARSRLDGERYGRRSLPAFARGVVFGVRMRPQRYL